MPVLGCGAQMSKLMDVSDSDVAVMEDTIAERLALGVSQAVAQRQAVDEALAQLADERSAVMKAVQEQLGVLQKESVPEVSEESQGSQDEPAEVGKEFADPVFSNRSKPDPKKTVNAFKLFRVDAKQPGMLFPLFVDANTPVVMGTWLDAEEGGSAPGGKVKSKIGPLAYRPGWHAGDFPVATHIGGKSDSSLTAPDVRPPNQVWAEVELAADRDWQTEADKRGTNASGRVVPVKAHITDQLPVDGYYRYKTNSNMTGNWLIGGSMKVNRVLSDGEVQAMNALAGLEDLAREAPMDWEKYGFDKPVFTNKSRNLGDDAESRASMQTFGREIAPVARRAYGGLSDAAKQAVDSWNVNWSRGTLVRAFAEGSDLAQEIDSAFEPVRDKLREAYGDSVPAYRGEQSRDSDSLDGRNIFSWTPLPKMAKGFAVNWRGGLPPAITDAQVDAAVSQYERTGFTRFGSLKYVKQAEAPYYYIYQGKEMITDGDDLRESLKSEQTDRDEWRAKLAKRGAAYQARLPVESIKWIPVGANLSEPEFIAQYDPRKDPADQIAFSNKSIPKGLEEEGYVRQERGSPRRYKEFGTWEKDGVRVALSGNVLADERGAVIRYMADDGEMTIEALLVDADKRGSGRATQALKTVTALADTLGKQLYIEPVQLEKNSGLTVEQLKAMYAKAGFIPDGKSDKVMVREPKAAFANKARPAPLAEETAWQATRRKFQDQYIHVQAVQDVLLASGGTVGVQQDVYKAEERMHGRAQEKLIDFGRNLLEPLLKKAADAGIELDELSAYAYAMHAQERNQHIDGINPKMQGAGSGMDDATAQNIMQMVQLSGDKAKFDDLHNDLMKLTEATRQEYLRSGLISQAEYDGWTNTYQNYVPLRGFENVDPEGNARPGVGSGLSVKGKESLKALGRRSRAADILENIVAEHERAVLRGERNIVAKTFLGLVQANPDPALWEVQPRKQTRGFDKTRNLVVYHSAPDTTDSIGVKVGGQQVYIKVKDELLLRSMTQAGKDKAGELHGTVVRLLGTYTNLLRNTLTRYNPVFGAINAVRDAPMGALSAYDTLGGEGAKLYAKYYKQALAASFRHERDKADMGKDMDRWLKEMRLAGGTTSGVFMRDVEEIKGDLRVMMLQAGAAPKNLREKLMAGTPAKASRAALHWLEIIGSTSEDAARLAAYRAAREMGKTAAEAASIAKNLTTNFNRSGEWGASINGLYLFFNAGVQGTTRLAQALKNPRVRKVLAAGTAAAMAVALANVAAGGDDDDGVPYWDQIPDYVKERNLVIMLPPGMEMDGLEEVGRKGKYIKIPIQYGLNMFMVLGYQLADLARNVKDPARGVSPGKAAINMASAVFGSINPFGGSLDPRDPVQVGMALLPTAGDAALQLMAGVNSFGRPVGPAKGEYDSKPDSETYSATQAGSASQRLASWMNSVTGGNEGRSGAIDVMPGTLDNAVRNTAGGLGAFVADTFVNLPIKYFAAPETISPRDVTLWRNFYGELDGATAVSQFYENRAEASVERDNAKREKKLDIEREYTDKELVLQDMGDTADKYTKKMSKIRKEEIGIALDPETSIRDTMLARRRLAIERSNLAKEYNAIFNAQIDEVERKK